MSDHRPSLEKIAPTVQEAIVQGAAELGVPEDALEVEILDEGSKGLFGLGTRQARVRLTLRQPGYAPLESAEAITRLEDAKAAPSDELSPEDHEAIRTCRETVSELLQRMGFQAQVEAHWGDISQSGGIRPLFVDVRGKDLSTLIGRQGETLSALQYITRQIVSKELHRPVAAIIDVEGYRSRRERQLRQMARRIAQQTIERGRRMALEPMPANERRIIHLELHNHPLVFTESVGEGDRRKVTIVPRES